MGPNAPAQPSFCTTCGAALIASAAYCSECGSSVARTAKPRTEPRRSVAPRAEVVTHTTADPLIGATVADRYVIESMIGRGGMGVVYKVQHAKIGKVMALKLLTGALARNRETVRRFKREAMMVSKLSHPNTVQVFDYGSAGGLTYLAMEYLSGYDLADLIDRSGPQPFPQMAKILLQACGALKEAHSFGMVHRDIKPENLFLTRTPSGEEIVKVLDFGLAKLREVPELGQITATGNIVGTPYYMPPEQVRGEDVDARGDIYSLCALLYTCLTGSYVFEAPTALGVLTAQLQDEPTPPHRRAPSQNIAPEVSDLILKGLKKDPAARYQSIDELAAALNAELKGQSQVTLHLESGAFEKVPEAETATRDEVERYENKLRRREQFARALGVATLLAASLGGYHLYRESKEAPPFDGKEREPNHEVATATSVPFGKPVKGWLGKRLSKERGDQDNFLITVPEDNGKQRTTVHLKLSALPNMGVCLFVFQKGVETPQEQFCSGVHARGIEVKSLQLRPGPYLFAIRQDLNQYAVGEAPLMHENVSDAYTLLVKSSEFVGASDGIAWETEPNQDENSADILTLGKDLEIKGALNTMKDRDIVCAKGTGFGQFIVSDAEGGKRPIHAVLEVTPLGGPNDRIPVRIQGSRAGIEWTERDQKGPWTSPPVDVSESPCVSLELFPNPWAPRPHPITAPASDHEWQVQLIEVDVDVEAKPSPTPAEKSPKKKPG